MAESKQVGNFIVSWIRLGIRLEIRLKNRLGIRFRVQFSIRSPSIKHGISPSNLDFKYTKATEKLTVTRRVSDHDKMPV